ncbi:MAG: tRNA (N(6)-L-threonylcarbamoyladenosine(37)-C(2))-methylthiotransferase MtaB [Nitrospira sp.]|nr:tRNA (N(6)-L-threonylcarbamoyladenosine(37)-C(2))-methylthiotransferase MtaB [Nitrospira sp.]
MKVSILTLGCKVNQAESSFIESNLINLGFSIVNLSEEPNYCIVNTCTVTSKSDYQSRQLIRRAVRSGAKVIATGCYSQLNPDEIKKIDRTIEIIQHSDKYSIIKLLTGHNASANLSYSSRSRPYVKVQDGCNGSCSYCIVPKVRGKSHSMTISDIVEKVAEFSLNGYKEVILTGIHLGSYGYDLKHKLKLSNLLITLLEKTTIERIRLSSIEANEVDNDLIALFKEKRICCHVHIPLQSGDDGILKIMNRMYKAKDFHHIIEKILKNVPGIAIGTDVIVGFPGEGEKEFSNTRHLLDMLPITYMHIFPFSARPNTLASKMGNQIHSMIKKKRFNELNILNIKKKKAYMNLQEGKTLGVIIEGHGPENTSIGTSGNYLRVRVLSDIHPVKSLVRVRITDIDKNMVQGIPIENL